MKIKYVTGSSDKFSFAKRMLEQNNIKLEQIILDIPEIQGEDYIEISIDKANKAFQILKEPLFITDTSWEIECLKGFPGPYMKSISKWFDASDYFNLFIGKKNRNVKILDTIVYIDKEGFKIFECHLLCNFSEIELPASEGGTVLHRIVKFKDKYIREYTKNNLPIPGEDIAWKQFAEFLKSK